MVFLVGNCFHWIGFHLVQYLLSEGVQIDGMGKIVSDKDKHLSMYFGRNALFSMVGEGTDRVYDKVIRIGPRFPLLQVESKQTIHLLQHGENGQETNPNTIHVRMPLLFGEWMPMNERGMYAQDDFITFESDYFQHRAVYIETFVKNLWKWVQTNKLPSDINVKTHGEDVLELENSVYIRDNVPNEEHLQTVRNHYRQFKPFY